MGIGIIRNVIKSSDLPTSIHTFADVQKVLNAHAELERLSVGMEMDEVTVGSEPMVWVIGNISSGEVIFVPKWCLSTTRQMNSTNTNVGGWNSSALRTWLNGDFYNSLPTSVKPYIKDRTFQTSQGNKSTALQSATDKIWLPREYEIFGATTYASATEHTSGNAEQFQIFAVAANRIKTTGQGGSALGWWESSPYVSAATSFCNVNSTGAASGANASDTLGVAPCFCMTPDGGGVELVDINPNKVVRTSNADDYSSANSLESYCISFGTGNYNSGSAKYKGAVSDVYVEGYKKIAFKYKGAADFRFRYVYSDGSADVDVVQITSSDNWTNYYDIPQNAIKIQIFGYYSQTSFGNVYISLLA